MGRIAKMILGMALFTGLSMNADAQMLRDYVNDAGKLLGGNSKKKDKTAITNTEIVAGLKEALDMGAKTATNKLSVKDGFFGNAMVKVLMPPEAAKVESTLRQFGMGAYVDKAILSMNRAAEDAAIKAQPIFIDAIKNMTIMDALNILKGNNDAATQYLRSKTEAQLKTAFKPVIEESLGRVNATKYWTEMCEIYNNLPTTYKKVNPDLAEHVTNRALNGVFVYIAEEENKIRMNPAARATDLLKKVFSYGK